VSETDAVDDESGEPVTAGSESENAASEDEGVKEGEASAE
jgi:hypothetical protein